MGARLHRFSPRWRELCQDSHVLKVIDHGVTLDFDKEEGFPPLTRDQLISEGHSSLKLVPHVTEMMVKGAVVQVPSDSLGFRSRIFLVPKKNGEMRPIINLKPLNGYLVKEKFKMETQRSIRRAISPGEWVVSIDLKDAYFHVPIAREYQKYFLFQVCNKTYKFVALPFGLSSAPREFTRVVTIVAHLAHGRMIKLHIYLDDWLIRAESPELCKLHAAEILTLTQELGFVINLSKSELVPTQQFDFLGEHFDLALGLVCPSRELWDKIQSELGQFALASSVTARKFLRLLGLMNSTADVVELGRLHMRPLQFVLLSQWKPFRQPLTDLVLLSDDCRVHLKWWAQEANIMSGVSLALPQTVQTLCTDSSKKGWGASLDVGEAAVSGDWPPADACKSINFLETKAILLTVQRLADHLKGKATLVLCDNTTAVSYFKRQGGTFSPDLTMLVWDTLLLCQKMNITLVFRHIAGKLNVRADQLSRLTKPIPTEWSLNTTIFRLICQQLGEPAVDLFATRFNKQLPVFVSPYPDNQALAVDALSMDWSTLPLAYAFPPSPILPLVLAKVKSSGCSLILIAPLWVKQSWFPNLLELLVATPLELPVWEDLLQQEAQNRFWIHSTPDLFRYHAWLVSGNPSLIRDFQLQLPTGSQLHSVNRPDRFTTPSGKNSVIGATARASILSRPLSLR